MNMKLKTLLLAVCTLTATATVISGCGRKPNTLTSAEKADGWQLLFDGETLDGWRDYNGDSLTGPWSVVDGTIMAEGQQRLHSH